MHDRAITCKVIFKEIVLYTHLEEGIQKYHLYSVSGEKEVRLLTNKYLRVNEVQAFLYVPCETFCTELE